MVITSTQHVSPEIFPDNGRICHSNEDFKNCIKAGETPAMYKPDGESWYILARTEKGSLCYATNGFRYLGATAKEATAIFDGHAGTATE